MRTVTLAIYLCVIVWVPTGARAQGDPAASPQPEAASTSPGGSIDDTAVPTPEEGAPPTPEDVEESSELEPPTPSGFVRMLDNINLQVHGFVSQGYIASANNAFLARSRHGGSFDLSEVGLNVTAEPVERLRIGTQLFARRVGTTGNFSAKFDWFYVDYRVRDWFGVRAGRTKIPFGLYNEVNDVDVARVPILLPQSTYPSGNRDYLLAQTGGEIYGRVSLRSAGTLEYRVYGGTIQLDRPASTSASPIVIDTLEVQYLVGGRLMWETPLQGLRVGASAQSLRLLSDLTIGGMPISLRAPVVLWATSAEFVRGPWLVAAEYGRWHTRYTSSDPTIYPPGASVSERAYVMASYQVAEWFHPGVYYSVLYPQVGSVVTDTTAVRHGRAAQSHDVAATLRFDINDYWLVKVEGHFIRGTAGLTSSLNGDDPLASLPWNTPVVVIRTTGYF